MESVKRLSAIPRQLSYTFLGFLRSERRTTDNTPGAIMTEEEPADGYTHQYYDSNGEAVKPRLGHRFPHRKKSDPLFRNWYMDVFNVPAHLRKQNKHRLLKIADVDKVGGDTFHVVTVEPGRGQLKMTRQASEGTEEWVVQIDEVADLSDQLGPPAPAQERPLRNSLSRKRRRFVQTDTDEDAAARADAIDAAAELNDKTHPTNADTVISIVDKMRPTLAWCVAQTILRVGRDRATYKTIHPEWLSTRDEWCVSAELVGHFSGGLAPLAFCTSGRSGDLLEVYVISKLPDTLELAPSNNLDWVDRNCAMVALIGDVPIRLASGQMEQYLMLRASGSANVVIYVDRSGCVVVEKPEVYLHTEVQELFLVGYASTEAQFFDSSGIPYCQGESSSVNVTIAQQSIFTRLSGRLDRVKRRTALRGACNALLNWRFAIAVSIIAYIFYWALTLKNARNEQFEVLRRDRQEVSKGMLRKFCSDVTLETSSMLENDVFESPAPTEYLNTTNWLLDLRNYRQLLKGRSHIESSLVSAVRLSHNASVYWTPYICKLRGDYVKSPYVDYEGKMVAHSGNNNIDYFRSRGISKYIIHEENHFEMNHHRGTWHYREALFQIILTATRTMRDVCPQYLEPFLGIHVDEIDVFHHGVNCYNPFEMEDADLYATVRAASKCLSNVEGERWAKLFDVLNIAIDYIAAHPEEPLPPKVIGGFTTYRVNLTDIRLKFPRK